MKGEKLKGALTKAPREKAIERLSPGVYRGSKGGLVSQGGQAIRRQPQPQAPQNVAGAASGMRQPGPLPTQASPEQIGQMIAGQPLQNQMFTYSPEETQRLLQDPRLQQIREAMPQPSANMGGQYRLSPGVYGTREQAMQQMYQPLQGFQNAPYYMQEQPQQQMPTRQQLFRKF
jgi:hypothetical protein